MKMLQEMSWKSFNPFGRILLLPEGFKINFFSLKFEKNLEIKVVDRPIDYIQIGDGNVYENESFIAKYSDILIGGSLAVFLIVSNVVWAVVLKRRS